MRPSTLLPGLFIALTVQAPHILAIPTRYTTPSERGLLDAPGVLDNVLLFDAPAYPDPSNPSNTIAEFQTYVSLRSPDLGLATSAVSALLSSLGIPVGDKLSTLQERVKLIASVGLPGKKVQVVVPGCSQTGTLPATSFGDLGLASAGVNLGSCETGKKELEASVVAGAFDSRKVTATVFPSKDEGFGVISDIDDTIKVSNVLDTGALLKSTFLDAPTPVAGMPGLYKTLADKLQNPQFVYITGSPYQLYPFLNGFIDTSFPSARGPVFTQNLTVVNIPQAIEFLKGDEGTEEFKKGVLARVRGMYPNKRWLAIGDSTQRDPEAYAAAFKADSNFISCIWIRQVEGADNTPERFAAAFEGIPEGRFRIFKDGEIKALEGVDVAGGSC